MTIYNAITDPDEISAALSEFYETLLMGDPEPIEDRLVGFPGGSEPHPLYWYKDPGLWMILEDNEDSNRSWNCFGTTPPGENLSKPIDIVCEINFPHEGINRRIAGVFVKDARGRIHIAHSGRIGGSKGPAAKSELIRRYEARGRCIDITWPDGLETRWIRIASLGSKQLLQDVYNFVCTVGECKNGLDESENARPDKDDAPASHGTLAFRPEFSGARAPYTPSAEIEASNGHGAIVNALHAALQKALSRSKYTLGNDRERDLVIARGTTVIALFEVKSDTDLSSIYGAIGQLSYHTANDDPPPARVLVTPEGLPRESARRLKRLGIEHLACRWVKDRPEFPRLTELVEHLGLPQ